MDADLTARPRWVPPPTRTMLGWLLAIAPFMAWTLRCYAVGERRWEFAVFIVGMPLLAFAAESTRKLLLGLYPIAVVGLLYDAMRYVQDLGVTPARLHDCDIRAVESRLFGFGLGGGRTVHDWLQAHTSPVLDVLCSIPYGTFIFAMLAMAVYLYFADFPALQRFGWTFLMMNVAAFVTYHVYPAAPPWYFHAHGCALDLTVHASEGPNLARVDGLLGFPYFHAFYGRSHDVFGAVPSLHVAYPLLILREGWRHFRPWLRVVAGVYAATMCFGAVYLDHHWLIDVLLGVLYAIACHTAVGAAIRALRARREVFVGRPA